MTQERKNVIRRVFEEVWNKNDLSYVDQVYAANYVAHVAGAPRDVGERCIQFRVEMSATTPSGYVEMICPSMMKWILPS